MEIVKVSTRLEYQHALLRPGRVHIVFKQGFPKEDYVEVTTTRLPEGKTWGLDLENDDPRFGQ